MPKPRPPHLQRHRSRHGTETWYVRRPHGPLIRIRGVYGTPEFTASYEAALAVQHTPKIVSGRMGSLAWLWNLYTNTPGSTWLGLSDATKKQRLNIMKPVLLSSGAVAVADIDRLAIIQGRDKRMKTPFQARHFVDSMRQMYVWALDQKEVTHVTFDPTEGVKVKKPKSKGFAVWSDADAIQYELKWPPGTRQRIMFDVFCYTGLRRGDAAAVGPKHVVNGIIELVTQKTGEIVHIPIMDALKESLALGPTGEETFIVSATSKPYVKESLGNAFGEACRDAGLVGKSAHGLRKAAATRAADNGATEAEMEALFGWRGGQMASLYTQAANRRKLALGAIQKMARTG